MTAEKKLGFIDGSHCALVTWVDLDGTAHMHTQHVLLRLSRARCAGAR